MENSSLDKTIDTLERAIERLEYLRYSMGIANGSIKIKPVGTLFKNQLPCKITDFKN